MDNFGSMIMYMNTLGTGFNAYVFKQVILQHGGSKKEMSQLVKSAQHVLANAGRRTPGKNHNHLRGFLNTF